MDQENPPQGDRTRPPTISKREKLYLTLGDLLMIVTIIVDLLYLSGLIPLQSGDMLSLNVLAVSISFVVYQMKKRIRRRTIREMRERVEDKDAAPETS